MFLTFVGPCIGLGALLFIGLCFSKLLFGVVLWLLIKLPLSLIFMVLGVVLCCTIILIPIGIMCFKAAGGMLLPCS